MLRQAVEVEPLVGGGQDGETDAIVRVAVDDLVDQVVERHERAVAHGEQRRIGGGGAPLHRHRRRRAALLDRDQHLRARAVLDQPRQHGGLAARLDHDVAHAPLGVRALLLGRRLERVFEAIVLLEVEEALRTALADLGRAAALAAPPPAAVAAPALGASFAARGVGLVVTGTAVVESRPRRHAAERLLERLAGKRPRHVGRDQRVDAADQEAADALGRRHALGPPPPPPPVEVDEHAGQLMGRRGLDAVADVVLGDPLGLVRILAVAEVVGRDVYGLELPAVAEVVARLDTVRLTGAERVVVVVAAATAAAVTSMLTKSHVDSRAFSQAYFFLM
ncbi:MAG: hypothetical protein A2138_11705 [Deltaproteobacteria bacterium RBG_16_71_12]|nr:MAG: hypothetical protein A2138_11705 [Deltaproteobacteria bacterium RBG_16_71_12]